MVKGNATWAIYCSFILALMLSAMPLPNGLEWGWPEWVPMVLIYWCMALPHRVGLGTAWVLGLLVDLLQSSYLGLNALSLVLIAWITCLLYRRLRMYRMLQQALAVLLLIALNQFISRWGQALSGNTASNLMYLLPTLVSALVWPWLFVVLRSLRQALRVN